MLTDEQISELRRLLDAATPGHWTTEKPTRDHDGWATGVAICCVARGQCVYSDTQGGSMPESDRQLIAALRNAAPALLSAHADAVRLREAMEQVAYAMSFSADTCEVCSRERHRIAAALRPAEQGE